MNIDTSDYIPSRTDADNWIALGAGTLMLMVAASRRSIPGVCLAIASTPLLYRGITGEWPAVVERYWSNHDRKARRGDDGVLESIRLEMPLEDVSRLWSDPENRPRFITESDSVTFDSVRGGRSTQVTVHLHHKSRGLGVNSIREELRRLKQTLEAGELAQAMPGEASR
jgi:uncharacterized membrane protein